MLNDDPGVPAEEIGSLVKRFTRGRAAGGTGAGLGLAIVDTLARRMGAKLVLLSPPPGHRAGFEARLEWRDRSATTAAPLATSAHGTM